MLSRQAECFMKVLKEIEKGKHRIDAMHIVATDMRVTRQTVWSHITREMGFKGVDEFDLWVRNYLHNKQKSDS